MTGDVGLRVGDLIGLACHSWGPPGLSFGIVGFILWSGRGFSRRKATSPCRDFPLECL